MDTLKAIAGRSSVRAYTDEQVSAENLNTVLEAGCAAPVGMGQYDKMHITVVQDKGLLSRISERVQQMMQRPGDPLYGAPTLIMISSAEMPMPGLDYADGSCIAENMQLAAVELGLGSVIIWAAGVAANADPELKKDLEIPDGNKAVISIVLGTPAVQPPEKKLGVTIDVNYVR